MNKNIHTKLIYIYDRLFKQFGSQNWWPADEPFEVMVGAVLTQSAAWSNVEKAIINLKKARVLKPASLRSISMDKLADLIYPCGYYNVKARKLRALAGWIGEKLNDRLEELRGMDTTSLRTQLLGIYGIGEETADSILLYACDKPVFVIDAYSRRIIDRLGFNIEGGKYADYQRLFMENLKLDVFKFNEYHALLVALGKTHCRKTQICRGCCLTDICENNKVMIYHS